MDFETLKISGLSVIKAMIASGSEETQYLDFKRKADPGRTDLQRDDKKALGEAGHKIPENPSAIKGQFWPEEEKDQTENYFQEPSHPHHFIRTK